jgi:large subunit ribosomal protein L29
MNSTEIKQFKKLEDSELKAKIVDLSSELVKLRVKKVTRQSFKSQDFGRARKKLAQLLTIQKSRILSDKKDSK